MDLIEGLAQAKRDYQDKKDAEGNPRIAPEIFQRLVQYDPTAQKKYIEWICRRFVEEGSHYDRLRDFAVVRDFDNYVTRGRLQPPANDIYTYKTVEALIDKLIETEGSKSNIALQRIEDVKGGSEIVLDNGKCVVYKVMTKAAAQILGADEKWCTSHPNNNYNRFNSYQEGGGGTQLYYVIPNSGYDKYGKWVVLYGYNGDEQFWNQKNDYNRGREGFYPVAQALGIPFDSPEMHASKQKQKSSGRNH